MSPPLYRARQRVVLRAKVRSSRLRGLVAWGLLAVAVAAAWPAARRSLKAPWTGWKEAWSIRRVSVLGLPEPAASRVASAFDGWLGRPLDTLDAAKAAARLKERFPTFRLEGADRDWLLRLVRLRVAARRGLARTGAGFCLDDGGELFASPEGTCPASLPRLAAEGAGAPERRSLAAFLVELDGLGAEKPALRSLVRGARGWELELADGTKVRWGTLDETAAKARRLREVLEDGQKRFGGAWTADLRYFDQGKVIVQPRVR